MKVIKLPFKKYLQVPLLYTSGGAPVPEWRKHLQPCEYLETDGNSYIQTNILPDNNLETIIKIENFNNSVNWFFGARYANGSRMYDIFTPTDAGVLRCDYQNINVQTTKFSIGTDQQLIVHFNYWDNSTKKVSILDFDENIIDSHDLNNTNFNGVNKIPLFAGYIAPNSLKLANPGTRIVYSNFKNNTTNEQLLNLISSYVIDEYTDNKGNICSAGVPGMIDVLTGIFYTNDGPGQFGHGGDIEI